MRFETIAREQAVAVSSLLDAFGCYADEDPVRSLRSLLSELSALSRRDVGPVMELFARWAEAKGLTPRHTRLTANRLQGLLDAFGIDVLDAVFLDEHVTGEIEGDLTVRAFSSDTRTVLPQARVRRISDPERAVAVEEEESYEGSAVVVSDLPFTAFGAARTTDPSLTDALRAARPAEGEILVAFCEWPQFAGARYLGDWLGACQSVLGRTLEHYADRSRGDRTLAILALPPEGPPPTVAFAPMISQAPDGAFDPDFVRSAVRGALRTQASRK